MHTAFGCTMLAAIATIRLLLAEQWLPWQRLTISQAGHN